MHLAAPAERWPVAGTPLRRWPRRVSASPVDGPDAKGLDALSRHLVEQGWLDSTVIYSNCDEPDDEQFRAKNIPFMKTVREKYPGLEAFLASDWHEDLAAGCDAWMTDLSASGYDPDRHRGLQSPELWHYYCHLPIHWQMRAPLVDAPNTQIDNPALEHRLALWMSSWYGARAAFLALLPWHTGPQRSRLASGQPLRAQHSVPLSAQGGLRPQPKRSEVRGQRSEVRGQRSEVRGQAKPLHMIAACDHLGRVRL